MAFALQLGKKHRKTSGKGMENLSQGRQRMSVGMMKTE